MNKYSSHTVAFHRARIIAGTILAAALLFVLLFARATMAPKRGAAVIDLSSYKLEVSDTTASRQQGLSGRDALGSFDGMLFVFGARGLYPFWMKETKFPLDIIWLDGGVVVDVATLQPPSEEKFPATHVPTHMADKVLELEAGKADELGIKNGAYVILPR